MKTNPARLSKSSMQENKMEAWLQSHASILLFICIIVLFLLVMALIVAMFNVSASPLGTESNVYYYHMEDII